MKRLSLVMIVLVFATALWAATASPESEPNPEACIGGKHYYICAMSQVLKYGGLVTGQPELVLGGAVLGAFACAFGW